MEEIFVISMLNGCDHRLVLLDRNQYFFMRASSRMLLMVIPKLLMMRLLKPALLQMHIGLYWSFQNSMTRLLVKEVRAFQAGKNKDSVLLGPY